MNHLLWNIYLVVVVFVSKCHNDTKLWKPNTDISDAENWEIKFEHQKECNGLAFAKINTATVFIKSLRVKELILPLHGVIEFDDDESFIQIDEKTNDPLNCIQLRSINAKPWGNFENWKSMENVDNPAVPHSERLPCSNDDLIFPHGLNTSILYDQYIKFRGKSFLIGENLYERTEFEHFLNTPVGEEIFKYPRNPLIEDPFRKCSVPNFEACEKAKNEMNLKCQNPVSPHGFCIGYKICGGIVLIDEVSLDKLEAVLKLQEFESNTYASKIKTIADVQVQVVFTEKDFTGKSLEEIQNFYNLLLQDKLFSSKNPQLLMSGPYYEEGLLLRSSLSLIFGTLFGVLLMFGILFYFYIPNRGEWSLINLRNSLVTTRPLSTYIFAKYDNLEDQARIFDGQSMAGSVLSLDRSKYTSKDSPSTSTASLDTIAPKDEKTSQTKTEMREQEFSEVELNDRKELSVELVDEDLLLKEL